MWEMASGESGVAPGWEERHVMCQALCKALDAHSLGEGPERNHYPISQVRQLRLMEMDELVQGVGVPLWQSRTQTQVYVTSRGPSSECQGDRRDSFLHPLNKYMLHRYDVPGTIRHGAVNKSPQ